MNDNRYRPYTQDRPDLLRCLDCSSRSTLVLIPADEREAHDELHDEPAPLCEEHGDDACTNPICEVS